MAGKGGARPGAGRKSKAQELQLSAIMDDIGNTEEILRVLFESAKNPKNFLDRQLWLSYKFGKPTEKIDMVSDNNITVSWADPNELLNSKDEGSPTDKASV